MLPSIVSEIVLKITQAYSDRGIKNHFVLVSAQHSSISKYAKACLAPSKDLPHQLHHEINESF